MALTELQMPTKENFYAVVRNAASEMNNLMHRWEDLSEFINTMEISDLDAMGVASGQVRLDLINFKTTLNEMVAFYRGESTTQTNTPANVIDVLRPAK